MTDEVKTTQPLTNQGVETTKSEAQVAQPTPSIGVPNPFAEALNTSSQEKSDVKTEKEQLQEYKLKFPDIVSSDVADFHINTFKGAGVEPDKAQKVIDALAQYEEKEYTQRIENLQASLEADKRALQQELGADYDIRVRDIARYFHEGNIPDEDVQSLVTEWGFQKTFKFFDRYAQMNKESSLGETFARSEQGKSTSTIKEDMFEDDKFKGKFKAQDAEALEKIRAWAEQQAELGIILIYERTL